MNIDFYSKTNQILEDFGNQNNNNKYNYNYSSFNSQRNNQNNIYNNKDNNFSLEKGFILNENNERIVNLNKMIKESKSKIENFFPSTDSDYEKEDIYNEGNQITKAIGQLNQIKSLYNLTSIQLQNDLNQMKIKKNRLIIVYNSLYNYKQKILKKEKEIKEKEYNINKYETKLKVNENILKNNFNAFNNYINYKTQNFINKFNNIKNYHEQKENELNSRERKINEYEMIIKNIIAQRENHKKEEIFKKMNINIGKKTTEIGIKEKEKAKEIINDIEIIKKEKKKIEKEKQIIELEKEQIQFEKEENEKFKKQNINFAKKLKEIEMNINQSYQNKMLDKYSQNDFNMNNTFHTPLREIFNNSTFDIGNFNINNNNNNSYKRRKWLTPTSIHPPRLKKSNSYNINLNGSFFNNISDTIQNNNVHAQEDEIYSKQRIKKIKDYIHDNIYLLGNEMNKSNNISLKNNKINNYKPMFKIYNSNRLSNKGKNEKFYNNNLANRTINLVDNINSNSLSNRIECSNIIDLNRTFNDENKSKYLEIKSNDYKDTFNDINKKIFKAEKSLQLIKTQEKRIKMIKDKLDKRQKNYY